MSPENRFDVQVLVDVEETPYFLRDSDGNVEVGWKDVFTAIFAGCSGGKQE